MGARGSGRRRRKRYHYQLRLRIVNIANRLSPSPIFSRDCVRVDRFSSSLPFSTISSKEEIAPTRPPRERKYFFRDRVDESIMFYMSATGDWVIRMIGRMIGFSEGEKEIGSALTRRKKKEERSGNRFSSGKCFQKRSRQRLDVAVNTSIQRRSSYS